MGRLPESFAGQRIHDRVPYTMPGTLILASAQGPLQFPSTTFMLTEDKPFEIHRVVPRLLAVDGSNLPIEGVAQDLMTRLISIQIEDLGKEQFLTKEAVPIYGLTKGTTEKTWEWADPYTLRKGESFIVNATADTYPTLLTSASSKIMVQIDFEGFLIVFAPPSDQRGGG